MCCDKFTRQKNYIERELEREREAAPAIESLAHSTFSIEPSDRKREANFLRRERADFARPFLMLSVRVPKASINGT